MRFSTNDKWPKSAKKLCERLGIAHPILQAPMAGMQSEAALSVAVFRGGGLGAIPCAMLNGEQIERAFSDFRSAFGETAPLNLNFFAHQSPPLPPDFGGEKTTELLKKWLRLLEPYYAEMGVSPPELDKIASKLRKPLDEEMCALIEKLRPSVVSFHFGLPNGQLFERIKATGAFTLCSATTVEEAKWLEMRGIDAVIAQGAEAGGHRGTFLGGEPSAQLPHQMGTMALLPQIVDSVCVPVVAAGGIVDGRGVRAALELGADAVQIGTAFQFAKECECPLPHRRALREAEATAITNLFTGRPARSLSGKLMRELGPLVAANSIAPFPLAASLLAPLRVEAAKRDKQNGDCRLESRFMPFYTGQSFALARQLWTSKGGQEWEWSATDMVKQIVLQALG